MKYAALNCVERWMLLVLVSHMGDDRDEGTAETRTQFDVNRRTHACSADTVIPQRHAVDPDRENLAIMASR